MGGKRNASEEERELFEATLSDAVPLKAGPRRPRKPAPPKAPTAAPPSAKATRAAQGTAGVDGNTADKLRRGLLEPQARLDLHGLTERAAHGALVTFLRSARSRKLRLVLVVTGKGLSTDRGPERSFDLGLDTQMRGILRSMTPRWLAAPGLAELVADVREAHRRHGGAGALYIYLRKGSGR
ncbi:MAG: Smr/MutS family protein [Rhizomicrobium sp.]